jgi:hypothetical protein
MSLINEALKKAQNQRTVELPAAPSAALSPTGNGAQATVRIAKRPPPLAARTLIGLIGGGVFGLLAVGVVSFFYFSASTTPPAAVAAKPPAAAPVPAPVANAQPAALAASGAGNAAPPVAPAVPSVTTQPLVTVSLPPIPAAAPAGAVPAVNATPPRPTPPPAPAAPSTNPKISEFVDALRISVVRLSPTDPKVVLNGQVFRSNDVVDRGLNVRLIKIEAARLVFKDTNGCEYIKAY